MNTKITAYFKNNQNWKQESLALREVILECDLEESLKWGKPCYSFEGSNIVIIQSFKKYCALLFFKGVLLKDTNKVLVKTGENTQVGRQIRFESTDDVLKKKNVIQKYIKEAIKIEKAGIKVEVDNSKLDFPAEFKKALSKNASLKKAFESLTPGRQRAYNIYFSSAKQSATRESRIEKCVPKIMKGLGPTESV